MKLVLVAGAGASRDLAANGRMPLMADWSNHLIGALDKELPDLAGALGLGPGITGEQFEEVLGAFLKWRELLPLQERFATLGGVRPNEQTDHDIEYRERQVERAVMVMRVLNQTLYELFGRRAISDDLARQAYSVLLGGLNGLEPKELVCVTTNYDVALEAGLAGLNREADTGFVRPGVGAAPRLKPSGMVQRAREAGKIPVVHLHGAVGWYADGSEVVEDYADRPYSPGSGYAGGSVS